MEKVALLTTILQFLHVDNYAIRHGVSLPTTKPLVIAHRGSSGTLPEHTASSYTLAVREGCDLIECDLAFTSDFHLVCRHESWLSKTTDVATRPEFADRRRTYVVQDSDGDLNITDWFTPDFTLEDLKTLRTVQQPSRDQSQNGLYPIASLEEFLSVAKNAWRPVGVYIELKHPRWMNSLLRTTNSSIEDLLLQTLDKHGYKHRTQPCFIQCFEEATLVALTHRTHLPLVMLTGSWTPTDSDLQRWSKYGFYGCGPWKGQIAPHYSQKNGYKNWISNVTDLISRCHRYELKVHAYTFRNEATYLAWDYQQDPYNELEMFYKLGIDGYFTDFPATLVRFLSNIECNVGTLLFSKVLLIGLCFLSQQ